MGSQNSKLQLDSVNLKSDNPFLQSNLVNGQHLSGGSTILKPNYHTIANYPNFSASTQDNTSKRNSSYAEVSSTNMAIPRTKGVHYRFFHQLEEFHTNEESGTGIRNYYGIRHIFSFANASLLRKQLPPGNYQYKFVVDGEWKYSPEDQTYTDTNSNINNLIDLNNYNSIGIIKNSYVSSNNTLFSHLSADTHYHSLGEDSHLKQQQFLSTENIEPNFNEEAPPIPAHLLNVYHLNEKERKNMKFWEKEEEEMKELENMEIEQDEKPQNCCALAGFLKALENRNVLSPPEHIDLNRIGSLAKEEEKNYEVFSLSQRFKAKYVTLKYYAFRKNGDIEEKKI